MGGFRWVEWVVIFFELWNLPKWVVRFGDQPRRLRIKELGTGILMDTQYHVRNISQLNAPLNDFI